MCLYLASENGGNGDDDNDDNDDDDEDDDDCLIVGGGGGGIVRGGTTYRPLCCVASGLPRSPYPYRKYRIVRSSPRPRWMDKLSCLEDVPFFFLFGETRLDEYQARWEVTD